MVGIRSVAVIAHVAGRTCGRQADILAARMTIGAVQAHMRTREREQGTGVSEFGSQPHCGGMA